MSARKRIAVLGSTGSIGRGVLDVVEANPDAFEVLSLSGLTNVGLLAEQAERFRVKRAAVGAEAHEPVDLPEGVELTAGRAALEALASDPEADLVVNALVGTAGLAVTLAAVRSGKRLALANKESLVMAGDLITRMASETGSELIPVDSEHSSIFRCIRGGAYGEVGGVILTASGGPLRDLPASELASAGVEEALDHPTWDMGEKITVDSATLANKAMEVIEARWLFGLSLDAIEVVLHRESVVHSFVRLSDGSLLAHLGSPDMRIPIQYALCYPDAPMTEYSQQRPADMGRLTFAELEEGRHPCFDLILRAARTGGVAPAVACVADEVAVASFLRGEITFGDISTVMERTIDAVPAGPTHSLDAVIDAVEVGRSHAAQVVGTLRDKPGRRRTPHATGRSKGQ
ncbi:MAG: 1-deoxy-D-xylulose-5-phosphate reductoisomerase [Candidatus Eisenbacteria bacterium]|nr:1-deoxy-D-xylulose-5-phosphate reductoisomerase [Candidatus Eisenbacteria bacterium]